MASITEEETDWDAFTDQLCRKIYLLEKENESLRNRLKN